MTSAALVRIQAVSPCRTIFAFDFVSISTEEVLAAGEGTGASIVFSTVVGTEMTWVSAVLMGTPVGVICANALQATENVIAATAARNVPVQSTVSPTRHCFVYSPAIQVTNKLTSNVV